MRLPKSLVAFSLGVFVVTLPAAGVVPAAIGGWVLAVILAAVVAWGLAEMFLGMTWGGPQQTPGRPLRNARIARKHRTPEADSR